MHWILNLKQIENKVQQSPTLLLLFALPNNNLKKTYIATRWSVYLIPCPWELTSPHHASGIKIHPYPHQHYYSHLGANIESTPSILSNFSPTTGGVSAEALFDQKAFIVPEAVFSNGAFASKASLFYKSNCESENHFRTQRDLKLECLALKKN